MCLGAVDDFDVWVWLVLWFDWVDMVELCWCLLHCMWHCEVYSSDAAVVIPFERYSAISFCLPIDCAHVVFLDCIDYVDCVLVQ